MNAVAMTGNPPSEPVLIDTNALKVCELRIAVDSGRHAITYIDVRTFGEQAHACTELMHTGSHVAVDRRLAYQ